jgi:glutamine synthetase
LILQLKPVVATEIEFYLFGSRGIDLYAFWQAVHSFGIPISKWEKEKGAEQYEIALQPTSNIERIVSNTERLKALVSALASDRGMQASFAAKPLEDDVGSGLHIHVHLEDEDGRNVFYKNDESMSDELAFAIGGLLANMKNDLPIFVPTEESKKRFVAGCNVPMTVSWGANNRSCAIRLPIKPHDKKHIEHRVSGADADVGAVIDAVLRAIEQGIEQRIYPQLPQIYGDASVPMYGLPKLFSE